MTAGEPREELGSASLDEVARSIDYLNVETVPSPELLGRYELVAPGMSESVLRMERLEREQQQRLVYELVSLERATAWAATFMAVTLDVVLLLSLVSVAFLVSKDQQLPALVIAGVAAIGPLVLTLDRYILRFPSRKGMGRGDKERGEGGDGAIA